jgi:hypothetical protein
MERESLLVLELLALEMHTCGEERGVLGTTGPEVLPVVHL